MLQYILMNIGIYGTRVKDSSDCIMMVVFFFFIYESPVGHVATPVIRVYILHPMDTLFDLIFFRKFVNIITLDGESAIDIFIPRNIY